MRMWIGFAAALALAACASESKPTVKAPSAPSASEGPLQGKSYACASPSASGKLVLAADQYEISNAAKNLKSGRGRMMVSGATYTPLSGPLVGKVGQRGANGAIAFEAELLGSSTLPLTCTPG